MSLTDQQYMGNKQMLNLMEEEQIHFKPTLVGCIFQFEKNQHATYL